MKFFTPDNFVTALVFLNFMAFSGFGIDKMLAESGKRRIAENTLLFWAIIGGTPGAYLGRVLFRHKTRKQLFSNRLHFIAMLQAVLVTFLFTWYVSGLF